MRMLQGPRQGEANKAMTAAATPVVQGLAGWLLDLLQGCRGQREIQRRQLRLVETLPLGGKRQLMLVTCAGESFLVGGGFESVETIVRVKTECSPDDVAKGLDGPCR
jgi:flagellar biogenesis protein FliO